MIVVLTGPESSGKTSLAQALAEHYDAPLVAEQARDYLTGKDEYLPSDVLRIGRLQRAVEQQTAIQGRWMICDTDLQVIAIWWREKFGPLPRSLVQAYLEQSPRTYLLCRPDLPWQPDPLRENPHDRTRLYDLYHSDLSQRNLPFAEIDGIGDARLHAATSFLDSRRDEG